MKVFLIKTPEYNQSEFNDVADLLISFNKAFKFVKSSYAIDTKDFPFLVPKSDAAFEGIYNIIDEGDERVLLNMNQKFKMSEALRLQHGCLTFEQLFSLCESFRAHTKDAKKEDFVVLLTKWNNGYNFFSSFNSDRNVFVKTSNWQEYTEGVDVKYPIAQQVVENILSTLMNIKFDAEKYITDAAELSEKKQKINTNQSLFIHEEPKGCLNDLCRKKEQVILKLQKANLCSTCIQRVVEQRINPSVFKQIMSVCEGISDEFSYKRYAHEYLQNNVEPYNLVVEVDEAGECDIFIVTPARKLKIRLGDREKMLYVFFLNKKVDVRYDDLGNDENITELLSLYKKIRGKSKMGFQESVVNNLINKNGILRNLIANINSAIHSSLGNDDLSRYYTIALKEKGSGTYAISLPKNLVDIRL